LALLENVAIASDYPRIGIVVELENDRSRRTLAAPV